MKKQYRLAAIKLTKVENLAKVCETFEEAFGYAGGDPNAIQISVLPAPLDTEVQDPDNDCVERIITAYGLQTTTWGLSKKYGYGCAECCTGDRCDEDCKAKYRSDRKNCPHCKGRGWIPALEAGLPQPEPLPVEKKSQQLSKAWPEYFGGSEEKEYEPYSDQWVKEIMKMPKKSDN